MAAASFTIEVKQAEEVKLSLFSKFYAYPIACNPPLIESAPPSVRRRYDDFLWLRNSLRDGFPGYIIPPLPEKKIFGKMEEDELSLAERKGELQYFLTCIAQQEILKISEVFQHFMSMEETPFWAGKVKIGEQWVTEMQQSRVYELYKEMFPHILEKPLPVDLSEQVAKLKAHSTSLKLQLKNLVDNAHSLISGVVGHYEERENFLTSLRHIDQNEGTFVHLKPDRHDCELAVAKWSELPKSFDPFSIRRYKNEMAFVGSVIEVLNGYTVIATATNNAVSQAAKARTNALNKPQDTKVVQQKDEALENEKTMLEKQEISSRMLFFHSIPDNWNFRVTEYKKGALLFIKEQIALHEAVMASWQHLVDGM